MALTAIVRKEVFDSIRTYTLLGLTLSFVLFAGFLASIQHVPTIYRDSHVSTSTLALLNSMRQSTVFFVPMIGLGIGYTAIVGERESGSLKIMLGLPHSRGDVVLGKFIGRTTVVAVSILIGYATAGLIALLTYDSFAPSMFVTYTVLTVLYGAVFVATAIGFSAWVETRTLALMGAVCLYVLFLLVWDVFLLLLQLLVVGPRLPETGLPEWIQFIGILNPSTAFAYAARAVIPEYYELTSFPESNAVYLQEWVGFLVLALWIVVPLGLGYARFEKTDL